ncbi:iron-containing alcohol dehydrogenase [Paucilactobacillus suebicus]|uniref:Iron-containing alcohol dehydrogenase n=1 Tax=Paucilactobacillus suebicus DSM 5007 = KCTC 3549 TaxID=1423807 RepID=A0A0R1VWY6_9LACO|nr:iron-containing alcohol dehydrogenase [Paucilactobacillus suebicus]KRM09909.1 iron-containing alcohol dehydrogenase [Paucilactobacillus suebicus DSM 5007 = KCTC 3549]
MENFQFNNPTDIRFGKGHIEPELHDAVAQFGNNVLFVYGGHSIKKSGLYDQVKNLLKDLNIVELGGVAANPKIESVREGQKLAKDNNVDVILAVGGGSVIDASKVISSAKFYDGDPWDLVVNENGADSHKIDEVPIVDILTLSATGTEMNRNAVISNMEINEKIGTTVPNTPAVSFLDPSLTETVPARQTAAGSIDIMSHLTEQYFDCAENNDVSKGLIEGIMQAVIKWAPIAIKDPTNYDARANLMWASTMALNSIVNVSNINEWTVHPLEHELSAYYDITHGIGLGILTPRWMNKVIEDKTTLPLFARLARNVWHLSGDDDLELAKAAIQKTSDWNKSLGAEMTLPEVGIKDETNFEAMAKSAVKEGSLDTDAYIKLTVEDAVEIYRASLK